MRSTRLTPEKWIAAGLEALAKEGPQALAAEPLARALGTTKGSFYWHFKDVPAFQSDVLAAWRRDALAHVIDLLQKDGAPDKRLRAFGRAILADETERSLRIWAARDARVAAICAEVDAERRQYLTTILASVGLGNADFATALQATLIGLPQLDSAATPIAPFDTLVDTVLALSE
ncbi:MAG: TetR/AcrR family transcriptional regulator [Sulfitobacter sp.]|nr:TetR/AcrR family transcriptional regulator [Sulfitobacter sp.]